LQGSKKKTTEYSSTLLQIQNKSARAVPSLDWHLGALQQALLGGCEAKFLYQPAFAPLLATLATHSSSHAAELRNG